MNFSDSVNQSTHAVKQASGTENAALFDAFAFWYFYNFLFL